jgi:hypothetical protein
MAVKRVTVHCVEIEDKPGSLHRFLSQSSLSGVDFMCFTAFSCGNNRSRVVVCAKDTGTFEAFAKEANIKVSRKTGFIITGQDRCGAAADAIAGLAANDVPGVVGAAMAAEGRYQMLVVVDNKDAELAQKALSLNNQ